MLILINILIVVFLILLYYSNTQQEGYKGGLKKLKKAGKVVKNTGKTAVKNVKKGFKNLFDSKFIKIVKGLFTKDFLKKEKIGDDNSD